MRMSRAADKLAGFAIQAINSPDVHSVKQLAADAALPDGPPVSYQAAQD